MEQEQNDKMQATLQQALNLVDTFVPGILNTYFDNKNTFDKLEEMMTESMDFVLKVQSESDQGTIVIVQEYFDQLTKIPRQCQRILITVRDSVEQIVVNYCGIMNHLHGLFMQERKTNFWIEKVDLLIPGMTKDAETFSSDHRKIVENEVVKAKTLFDDWKRLMDYYEGVFRESKMFQMKKNILECFDIGFREFHQNKN